MVVSITISEVLDFILSYTWRIYMYVIYNRPCARYHTKQTSPHSPSKTHNTVTSDNASSPIAENSFLWYLQLRCISRWEHLHHYILGKLENVGETRTNITRVHNSYNSRLIAVDISGIFCVQTLYCTRAISMSKQTPNLKLTLQILSKGYTLLKKQSFWLFTKIHKRILLSARFAF